MHIPLIGDSGFILELFNPCFSPLGCTYEIDLFTNQIMSLVKPLILRKYDTHFITIMSKIDETSSLESNACPKYN